MGAASAPCPPRSAACAPYGFPQTRCSTRRVCPPCSPAQLTIVPQLPSFRAWALSPPGPVPVGHFALPGRPRPHGAEPESVPGVDPTMSGRGPRPWR